MDVGGRAMQEHIADADMDVGGRAMQEHIADADMDVGGRAMQGHIADADMDTRLRLRFIFNLKYGKIHCRSQD